MRVRRRRQAALVVAVSGLVVVLLVVSAVVSRSWYERVSMRFDHVRIPDVDHLRPPEEVWPSAVRRLPLTLPDGRRYTVAAVLDGGRYLVTTGGGNDGITPIPLRDPMPLVYDARAGTAAPLGKLSVAVGTRSIGDIVVVGGRAVWATGLFGRGGPTEVWSGRLDGGGVTLLVGSTADAAPSGELGVAGDSIVVGMRHQNPRSLAPVMRDVYTVPATGGHAAPLDGSRGYVPLHGTPWMAKNDTAAILGSEHEWWNVVNGERRMTTLHPAATGMRCWPRWCIGAGAAAQGEAQSAMQRPDGTGYKVLPPHLREPYRPEVEGRFVTCGFFVGERRTVLVWEVETGRAIQVVPPGILAETMPEFASYWLLGPVKSWPDGDNLLVLDLTAVV